MRVGRDPFINAYAIGLKLKKLRQEKRLTLSQLGAATGLSTALLSKLESDLMIPTLPTLAKICRVYGVGLGYFFSEAERESLAITRKAHMIDHRRGQPHVRSIALHMPNEQSSLISSLVEVPAAARITVGDPGRRTELMAYVIDGNLTVKNGGTEEHLCPGDCAVVETDIAAMFTASDALCRVLLVQTAR